MRRASLRTVHHQASRLGINPRRDGEGDAPLRAPNVRAGGEAPLRVRCGALLLFAAGIAAGPGAAQEAGAPPVVVRFADGNTVPLRQWSLSYEYFTWPEGGSQVDGTAVRRTAPELWVGRKAIPLGGATLQIEYVATERERDVDGEARKVKVPQARALKLVREGKTTQLKLEAPHRELLAPDGDKKQMVTTRSLDLRGESLTGTKMDICVVSYTVLVECGERPEHQVVQIEFPQ